jgi:small-conductance mechanosensitive channel
MLPQIFQSQLWSYTIFNNNLKDLFIATVSLFIFLAIFKILQNVIIRRLEKLAKRTKTDLDDTFIKIVNSLKPPFYFFLSFYLALRFLNLPQTAQKFIDFILIIWVVVQALIAVQILINYAVSKWAGKKDTSTQAAVSLISRLVKYTLWLLGALLVLANMGVNVTSLVAGLGIGGIAIALALQNILGDLFSSFAIFFDKPFQVGDFIIMDQYKGTVQHIGIKTTRVKSLDGEEIIIPNKKLTSGNLRNFKKMEERRVSFTLGVVYETPTIKLRKVPKIIKEIITKVAYARFDRAHFKEFADFSLNFGVVYFVESQDYKKYMDIHQTILFQIKQEFEREGIVMAYPTQTVYLRK